eukprot:10715-Chlamydomonas_euryale.AAC.1
MGRKVHVESSRSGLMQVLGGIDGRQKVPPGHTDLRVRAQVRSWFFIATPTAWLVGRLVARLSGVSACRCDRKSVTACMQPAVRVQCTLACACTCNHTREFENTRACDCGALHKCAVQSGRSTNSLHKCAVQSGRSTNLYTRTTQACGLSDARFAPPPHHRHTIVTPAPLQRHTSAPPLDRPPVFGHFRRSEDTCVAQWHSIVSSTSSVARSQGGALGVNLRGCLLYTSDAADDTPC